MCAVCECRTAAACTLWGPCTSSACGIRTRISGTFPSVLNPSSNSQPHPVHWGRQICGATPLNYQPLPTVAHVRQRRYSVMPPPRLPARGGRAGVRWTWCWLLAQAPSGGKRKEHPACGVLPCGRLHPVTMSDAFAGGLGVEANNQSFMRGAVQDKNRIMSRDYVAPLELVKPHFLFHPVVGVAWRRRKPCREPRAPGPYAPDTWVYQGDCGRWRLVSRGGSMT